MWDLREQRSSSRLCCHFEVVAAVARSRCIERDSNLIRLHGQTMGRRFQDLDMCKNILLLWTLFAIIDMLRVYRSMSKNGQLNSVEIERTVTEISM